MENTCAGVFFLIKFQACSNTGCFPVNFAKILRTLFLGNTSGGYFFQISPNLKRRRTENMQCKNELKTKQNSNSKLF